MHIALLVILTIFALIGSVLFSVVYISGVDRKDQRNLKWAIVAALCFLLFIGGLSWSILSSNEPWRPEYTSLHEVKDVVFPDGSKVQMFTCDGTHHNVTSMFGKVFDDNEWQIRRVRWSPVYLGVSWSSHGRCEQKNHYFLEHKNGGSPSVELTPEKDSLR